LNEERMMPSDSERELGRRGFLRSMALMGTGAGVTALMGACSDGTDVTGSIRTDVENGTKWVRVDAFDADSGEFFAYEGIAEDPESALTSDFELSGYSVSSSGQIDSLTLVVEKDSANALSLVSAGSNLYHIEAGGVPQPPGAPYEIHFVERTVTGTNVIVLTGYSIDPTTDKRVTFSITHDPLPILIVAAIAAAIAALGGGAALRTACGDRGGKFVVKLTGSGFTVSIVCNHAQGGGG
jgi:hypothetical protein